MSSQFSAFINWVIHIFSTEFKCHYYHILHFHKYVNLLWTFSVFFFFLPASIPSCFNYQSFKIYFSIWITYLLTSWKFGVGDNLRGHWAKFCWCIEEIAEFLRNTWLPWRSQPQVPVEPQVNLGCRLVVWIFNQGMGL